MSSQKTTKGSPSTLSRKQLSKFLPDHESIRTVEELFRNINNLLPEDIENLFRETEEASIDANTALSKTNALFSIVKRLEELSLIKILEPSIKPIPPNGKSSYIQFKDKNSFGSSSSFKYDKVNETLEGGFSIDTSGEINTSNYIAGKKSGLFGYITPPLAITITTASTYYPIGLFTTSFIEDFNTGTTYANGFKHNGSKTQYFKVEWSCSLEGDSDNILSSIRVEKNGALISGSTISTLLKITGEINNISGFCVVELSTNDEVQISTTSDTNGDIITFDNFNISINQFFN